MFPKNVQLIGINEKDNIMNKIKSEQSGRSMVEMLGVLAIRNAKRRKHNDS